MSASVGKPAAIESERRRSPRKPHVVRAYVSSPTARESEPREEALSINLSRHGIGFSCRREMAVGTYHIVDLVIGEIQSQTEVRVQSCRRRGDGQYEIGARFC